MARCRQSTLLETWLSACALAISACGGGAGGADPGGGMTMESIVSGSVTLPADANGTCGMIALDEDTSGSNSVAQRADGSYLVSFQTVSGSSASFSFDDVPGGSYYLWAY